MRLGIHNEHVELKEGLAEDAMEGIHNAQLYGEVAWLYGRSSLHREMAVRKLEQWALPPIVLGQFRLYRKVGRPTAFFTWAYLSAEVERRYAKDPQSLQPSEWQSGPFLWVTDFVAPFGDTASVMRDLRENVFRGKVGRTLRPYHNKNELRVVYFHGKDAIALARDPLASPTVDIR